jgi:long-chain acyl-CoA synthetase
MNVFDYLLGESGFLYKDCVLGNRERITYSELLSQSLRLARYLRETHGENHNIILISPNSLFFLVAYLAIIKSGNVCVPLNPAIEQHNLSFIASLCRTDIAFIQPGINTRSQQFQVIYQDIPSLPKNNSIQSPSVLDDQDFDRDRLAEIIFTSGSTGEPKGVMISHGNIIANTGSIIEYLGLTGDDVIEVVLPFYYCYGLSLLHTHLKVGGSIVLNNTFMFLGSVIRDLQEYRCTGFAGVPSHFQILLRKTKTFTNTQFPSLRYVTQAGGKLHNVFIREFTGAFPKLKFYVMYGQTEATARLSYLPPDKLAEKPGSIGRAIPGVELELADDTGRFIQEPGHTGALVARGDNIMKGYLGDEQATAATLQGGWLHTGDLAYRDEEGYFFLTARRKEIIKVGGKRISPKEVEEAIVSIPGVLDCSISGIDDALLGEIMMAEVVLADPDNGTIDEEYIKRTCASMLNPDKVPQIVEFRNSLEIAATGKKTKKSLSPGSNPRAEAG